jgi:hypothetical protein
LSSPATHANDPGSTSAYAEHAALNALRQREQWQLRADLSGAAISYRTRPQKHPPVSTIANLSVSSEIRGQRSGSGSEHLPQVTIDNPVQRQVL